VDGEAVSRSGRPGPHLDRPCFRIPPGELTARHGRLEVGPHGVGDVGRHGHLAPVDPADQLGEAFELPQLCRRQLRRRHGSLDRPHDVFPARPITASDLDFGTLDPNGVGCERHDAPFDSRARGQQGVLARGPLFLGGHLLLRLVLVEELRHRSAE